VVRSTRHSLGTRYEHVGLGDEDDEEVTDLTSEALGVLLRNEPLDDAPPPTDSDFDLDAGATAIVLLAAFPGTEVVEPGDLTTCAGCARLVTPVHSAVENGDTLCPDCCPDCYETTEAAP